MTLYRLPHYGYEFFAGTPDDVWRVYRKRKSLVGKTRNGMVTPSEESMTLITFYGFPHHGNRSFAVASG